MQQDWEEDDGGRQVEEVTGVAGHTWLSVIIAEPSATLSRLVQAAQPRCWRLPQLTRILHYETPSPGVFLLLEIASPSHHSHLAPTPQHPFAPYLLL